MIHTKPDRRSKRLVLLLSLIFAFLFAFLLYKAYINKRGAPAGFVEDKSVLIIPYKNHTINLKDNPDMTVWENIDGINIKLTYQATVEPWGGGHVTDLQVKAFHNGREIYFLLSYEDETNNESIGVDRFSDGAAIMFPLGDQIKPENIMMGFQGKVNIWHWRALEDREWREGKIGSSVTDLFSEGIGTLAKRDEQRVMGRGFRKRNRWDIIFNRSLYSKDNDAIDFTKSEKTLAAFAVFNGEKGDRGPRKSISSFIGLRIEKKD